MMAGTSAPDEIPTRRKLRMAVALGLLARPNEDKDDKKKRIEEVVR